jgi:hypothetical protein
MLLGQCSSYSDWLTWRDQPQAYIDGCATRRAIALRQRIFKWKNRFAKISLGLIYHSKALTQLLSRDTIPLRRPNVIPKEVGGTDWPIRNRRFPSPRPLTYQWHGIRGLKLSPQVRNRNHRDLISRVNMSSSLYIYMGFVKPCYSCSWRPLVWKFCILLWQARVGREIERYCIREEGKSNAYFLHL